MHTTWKAIRRALDRDALLRRVGLEERSPAADFLTGLGLFSVGVLVGAGLGLMFAPKKGDEIRAALNDAWRKRSRAAQEFARSVGPESAPPTQDH